MGVASPIPIRRCLALSAPATLVWPVVGFEAAGTEMEKSSKVVNHAHHIAIYRPTHDSQIVVDLDRSHTAQ